jgi:hypothetical protein
MAAMPRFLRRTAAAALVALPAVLAHCMFSTQCDDCGNGLSIAFQHAGAWAPGSYLVTLDYGSRPQDCAVTLPLTGNNAATSLPCSDSVALDLDISDAGDAVGITQVILPAAPSQLTVTITLNGSTLVTQSLSPSYSNEQSGGLNCGACNYGGETMTVP